MSICDSPYPIPTINITDCVGTSLVTINGNYKDLRDDACDTYQTLASLQSDFALLSSLTNTISSLTPGIPKALVSFNGYTTPPTVYTSYNIKEVKKLSTGTFSLSFTTALPNASGALIGTCSETISGGGYTWLQPTSFTTVSAGINIHSFNNNTTTLADPSYVSVIIYNK
jgi:hypothetical protein